MTSLKKYCIFGLLLLCLIPLASASSLNLTARTGETWIIYRWDAGYTVNIYIDGIKVGTSISSTDWYLTNINPDEKHQIKLYNGSSSTQLLDSLTVTTLHSQIIIIVLICVLIVFFIIQLFLKDPIKIILVGGLSASISLYTSQIALGYGALTIIPIITLVISGIFIALALWTIIIEKTGW